MLPDLQLKLDSSFWGTFPRCLFYFRVHCCANQNGRTRQVEPQEKNDHCANGAIGNGETVEKAEIQFESKRYHKPKRNAHHCARHEPVPSPVFNVRSVKVEGIESRKDETQQKGPLQNSPYTRNESAEAKSAHHEFT